MKINNQNIGRIPPEYSQPWSTPKTTDSGSRSSADSVNLSSRASDLSQAHQAYQALPDVRASRVAAVKASIENGTYHVASDRIADAMVFGLNRDTLNQQGAQYE